MIEVRSEVDIERHRQFVKILRGYVALSQQPDAKITTICKIIGKDLGLSQSAVYRKLDRATEMLHTLARYYPKEIKDVIKMCPNIIYGIKKEKL